MSAPNELARRSQPPRESEGSWNELESRYREECDVMLRDARRHFEQRAASEQAKIENALDTFARDFDIWLEREKRGEPSTKPNLSTLFEIWLERGARRGDAAAAERKRNAAEERANALQERLEAEATRVHDLQRLLAEKIQQPLLQIQDAPRAAPAKPWRARITAAIILTLLAMAGAAEMARREAPARIAAAAAWLADKSEAIAAQNRRTLADLATRRAHDETLDALFAADKEAIVARAIAAAPMRAMPKIEEAEAPAVPTPAAPSAAEPVRAPVAAVAPIEQAAPVPPPPIAAAPAPQKTASYRSFDNRDIAGATLATLRKADLPACAAACRGRDNCQAYVLDKWNHVCRLQSSATAFRLNPRTTSGLREDMRLPRAPAGEARMERYPSKAFPGAGDKTVAADGPDACEDACRTDESCVAFTFRLDEASCRLFESTGEYFSNTLADSGGKRQD
jgi:hypothetical protein